MGARELGAVFRWGRLVDQPWNHDKLASGLSRGQKADDTRVRRWGAKARAVHELDGRTSGDWHVASLGGERGVHSDAGLSVCVLGGGVVVH